MSLSAQPPLTAGSTKLGLLGVTATPNGVGAWTLTATFTPVEEQGLSSPGAPRLGPRDVSILTVDGRAQAPFRVLRVEWKREDVVLAIDIAATTSSALSDDLAARYLLALRPVPGLAASRLRATFTLGAPRTGRDDGTPASRPALEGDDTPHDYLAKDYPAFRALMLGRIGQLDAGWTDRSAADVGVMLVEVLAYAADQVSYHQDAVATEAYLKTARRRTSVRRHARLLGYPMHEGCNARVWVLFDVAQPAALPRGSRVLTGACAQRVVEVGSFDYEQAVGAGAIVFETMHDARLLPGLDEIPLHADAPIDSLPEGATTATLLVARGSPSPTPRGDSPPTPPDPEPADPPASLAPGTVLVLESTERALAETPAGDVSRALRHAVRLTAVAARPDTDLVDVTWHEEDALPFPLPLSTVRGGRVVDGLARARGNAVLADAGVTEVTELPLVPDTELPYRPDLTARPLVSAEPLPPAVWETASAAALVRQRPRAALPAVELTSRYEPWQLIDPDWRASPHSHRGPEHRWLPRRDLLASTPEDRHFVADRDSDGVTTLRFGDGVFGRYPRPGTSLTATWRRGRGPSGNVGADTLGTLAVATAELVEHLVERVRGVGNPIAAVGGTSPEPLERVRTAARESYQRLRTAVALDDYATLAQRVPGVAQARPALVASGAWPTIVVWIRRDDGVPVAPPLIDAVTAALEAGRLMGRAVIVRAGAGVSVDVRVEVEVAAGVMPASAVAALRRAFSCDTDASGAPGFFAPSRWPFGRALFASEIVAHALSVAGVVDARVTGLRRAGADPAASVPAFVAIGTHEVVRVRDDALDPAGGRIVFVTRGATS